MAATPRLCVLFLVTVLSGATASVTKDYGIRDKRCPIPRPMERGTLVVCRTDKYGRTCVFTCESGYRPPEGKRNVRKIRCSFHKNQWSSPIRMCTPEFNLDSRFTGAKKRRRPYVDTGDRGTGGSIRGSEIMAAFQRADMYAWKMKDQSQAEASGKAVRLKQGSARVKKPTKKTNKKALKSFQHAPKDKKTPAEKTKGKKKGAARRKSKGYRRTGRKRGRGKRKRKKLQQITTRRTTNAEIGFDEIPGTIYIPPNRGKRSVFAENARNFAYGLSRENYRKKRKAGKKSEIGFDDFPGTIYITPNRGKRSAGGLGLNQFTRAISVNKAKPLPEEEH